MESINRSSNDLLVIINGRLLLKVAALSLLIHLLCISADEYIDGAGACSQFNRCFLVLGPEGLHFQVTYKHSTEILHSLQKGLD